MTDLTEKRNRVRRLPFWGLTIAIAVIALVSVVLLYVATGKLVKAGCYGLRSKAVYFDTKETADAFAAYMASSKAMEAILNDPAVCQHFNTEDITISITHIEEKRVGVHVEFVPWQRQKYSFREWAIELDETDQEAAARNKALIRRIDAAFRETLEHVCQGRRYVCG